MSDKLFKGRRAPAGILFMVGVFIAVLVYWLNPPGNPMIDSIGLVCIGFLIYGPVMLIGLHALDLAPKKAAGTAAGLTGFFGYLGGATFASAAMGFIVDAFGWDGGFIFIPCILCTCNVLPCSYFKDRICKTKTSLSTNIILSKKRDCSFQNASLFYI